MLKAILDDGSVIEVKYGWIPLTSKDGGDMAIVDAEDMRRLSEHGWHRRAFATNGHTETVYAHRGDYSSGKLQTVKMHREIFGDIPEGLEVDHINGDGRDNRKENLRLVTRSQNAQNQRKTTKPTASKYKGVSYMQPYSKKTLANPWVAKICKDYQRMHIGSFATEEEAALAYNEKAKELHGEYARLNKIEGE